MKNTIKKTVSLFMAVAIMLTVCCGALNIKTKAGEAPIFSLDKVSESDTEVKVSISLQSGEFRYVTFSFTYGDKISALTSIERGTTLTLLIQDADDVMSLSNVDTGVVTVISVPTVTATGEYFVVTFSKASADTITSDDITAVEDEINAEIVNNLSKVNVDIALSESEITLYDGETKQLEATLTPDTGDAVTWTSNDESVATVVDGLVTAVDFGEAVITATVSGGATATCTVKVDMKIKEDASAEVEAESGLIYGSDVFGSSADEIADLFDNTKVTVNSNTSKIATGDIITFTKENGDVYKTLTVVVFGDVNCDGIYDGTDAMIVNCIVNGMLSRAQVGEAVYLAADCNHDEIVDEMDIAILNDAGLLLSLVPQTETGELDVSSVEYTEYLNCISQDVVNEEPQEEEPAGETTQPNVLDEIIAFVKMIVDYILKSVLNLFA